MDDDLDLEIEAMGKVSKAIGGLEEEVRSRVIRWAAERYGVALGAAPRKQAAGGGVGVGEGLNGGGLDDEEALDEPSVSEDHTWNHFAELYHASGASTHPEGMLVAAYWVQALQKHESFGSFELNQLLKDLGHGVTGTSKVMTSLIAKKPALILQLKKSGKTQQARKTYKLTDAGKKAVEQMIANGA
ncbi:hypothetical protein [Microbacterium sp. H1-D42]|uniref:hypothetical protein n=1 Tax=Microbacterium sp. H1-D42 TaxID=2925844 RepID=UPI001F52ED61|nr:hypothetical protein [Microbacterium sp. H1-D42]UNK71730.1 hypothetical protein MNR00_04530 [Microbacterium sp. H1-D42]